MKLLCLSASLLTAGLMLLASPSAHAQRPNSKEPGQKGLTFSSDFVATSGAKLKGNDATYRHVAIQTGSWDISQAFALPDNRSLSLGLGYSLSRTTVEEPYGWEDDDFWKDYKRTHPNWEHVPIPSRLQSLTASLEYSQEINPDWSLSTSVAVGSYVAKTGLLSDGWGVNASVMGLYNWSPTLTFAVGVAYDSLSEDLRIVPVLGFDWRFADKWSLALGVPVTALTYQLTDSLSMSLAASGSGGTYHVEEDPLPGAASRSLADSKLEAMEVRLGYKVDWKINKTFAVTASTGHVLYREFKYIDRNYRLKSRDAVPYISLGGSISL